MRVKQDFDEWYPVYILSADRGHEIEIPEELWKEYQTALTAFRQVQHKLRAIDNAIVEGEQ